MKTMRQKQRSSTSKCVKRGSRRFSVTSGGKSRTNKKKIPITDWQHLTKADIDIIIRAMNTPPPPPSKASQEARALFLSIPQLDSDR